MALDRYGEIWNAHHFLDKDLPSLQDVLKSCDQDALVRTVMDTQAASFVSAKDVQARSMLEASIRLSLDSLCELEREDIGSGLVFVPKASYLLNARKLMLSRFVDAALISIEDLPDVAQYRAALGGRVASLAQAERSLREASRALRKEGRDCSPEGIPFAFHMAEDLLSYRVWIPPEWCVYERYVFLAAILWEHFYSNADSLVGFLSHHALGACAKEEPSVSPCVSTDQLQVSYRQKMVEVIGALNHNAFLDCLDDQIELGGRLGLIA